ncbi:2-C-methyl-D-erythritol 4-phosphate cytidylyltransferase [Campylobacter insulaenigrae]|uniref:IspD/TarI family cytidylyltransferase n=1 Tax=Campylobacter insulaenigrae TaxID=260714 RepID=UPI0021532A15|nr:IspD/TarI family cytidylyltransferase [Campylobacter insulaenigrae]MCR6585065.1 2-C-methyl-D-erythritol 4-phosphate cytidylyltransferase [Campylobacter insulaenigrae]
MKTIALIFAGGTGQRMNISSGLPKQFLLIEDKPVIIHTLEIFSNHRDIDGIIVVCLREYIDELYHNLKKYSVKKVIEIVDGGSSGQKSIFNGLVVIKEKLQINPYVLIHDGVRPLITSEEISKSLLCAYANGNSVSYSKMTETVLYKTKNAEILNRDKCFHVKAPQIFKFNDIYDLHVKAQEECLEFIDSASMAFHYGLELYFTECSNNNIKLTTPKDFYMIQALMQAKKIESIFGV